MTDDTQAPVDAIDGLLQRLTEATAVLDSLAARPFDDLVGRLPADVPRAETLAERLQDESAELHRSTAALRQRLASAAERRWAQLRFTREGVETTLADLAGKRPAPARRRWAVELAAALAANEGEAVQLLLEHPAGIGDDRKLADIAALRDQAQADDADTVLRLVDRLRALLPDDVATRPVQADLALAQARAYLGKRDGERARSALDEVCASSHDPAVHAEQAFLLLALADTEAAEEAAERAASVGADSAAAFLAQGAVAEQRGDYAEADEMYRQAVARSPIHRVEQPQHGSLLLPSGLLHLHRARRLEEIGLPESALAAYRDAVAAGVSGPRLYADAAAYEGQVRLLRQLDGDPAEIRTAAYEAGRRYTWRAENERAVPLLRLAMDMEGAPYLTGFFLAAALSGTAWPPNSSAPDDRLTAESEEIWSHWLERAGPPDASDAWIYAAGAGIAEQVVFIDPDKPGWTWRALLRSEKAIVLDPQFALGWSLSSRYLRTLNFTALPVEAARRAKSLEPEGEESLNEMLALLANAGEFDEAMDVLRRHPKADSEPWLIGVRGWLRLHMQEPDQSVADMTKALEGGFDPGWNLDVRASGFIALGRPAEAVEDLRRITKDDRDFGVRTLQRRARAFSLLGDVDQAARELAGIDADDPLVDPTEYGATKVVVDACQGHAGPAAETVEELIPLVQTPRALADTVTIWRDALAVLEFRGVGDDTLAILHDALDRLAAVRPVGEPTPDEELGEAMERHAGLDSVAGVCLLAIRARRRATGGDNRGAADDYERLRGGPFEPEATRALLDTLTRALSAAVQAGDPDLAVQFHRRLAAVGPSPYSSEEFVIAEASRAAGAPDRAREALDRALAKADDPSSQFAANLQLGEAKVLQGDVDAGLELLTAALRTAQSSGDDYGMARAHARIACVLAQRDDSKGALEHLQIALQRFVDVGLMNTSTALAIELREATSAMGLPTVSDVLRGAYEDVTHEYGGGVLSSDNSGPSRGG